METKVAWVIAHGVGRVLRVSGAKQQGSGWVVETRQTEGEALAYAQCLVTQGHIVQFVRGLYRHGDEPEYRHRDIVAMCNRDADTLGPSAA